MKPGLLVCCLLLCASAPVQSAHAQTVIEDRSGDGVHIDDVVYSLTRSESMFSSEEVRDLLSGMISPTAGEVAATIMEVSGPGVDATSLALPSVPEGYTIAIHTSSHPEIIDTNGGITPPPAAADVDVVFTVTRIFDGTTADTSPIAVSVPQASSIFVGAIITATGESPSNEGKEKAFDGDTGTKWYTGSSTGWIQIQFKWAYVFSKYSITSANDMPDRNPKNWTLQGSNDGEDWTTLDTRSDQSFASYYQKNTYTFNNNKPYRYYRLEVTSNNGGGELQLSEIELLETPQVTVIDLSTNNNGGNSFGSTENEVKRFQTFTAINRPHLASVDVNIHKRTGTGQSDVTVELFATSNNQPTGDAFASATIPASSVSTSYSIINVELPYTGLVDGTKYAIVLGQATNSSNNYEWAIGPVRSDQSYGKFNGVSTWTTESSGSWLKVNVY
ncbi:discoidin domain-containing protein [Paenibacillus cymbidii]|uniref:discoidin domain-containing protein n=1 Tax=Paenibacillus cymbidii TaxID=1639034 RepID=UPI001F31F92E|nr:discoidin domain-containing protein [Paenibacillus cymbidii]